MRRRALLGLTLLALVLTVTAGAWLWQAVALSSVEEVAGEVERLKLMAGVVRLALIGLLALAWPRLVHLACRYGRVDEVRRDVLLALRWRVVGWLVLIELVLGQGVLGDLAGAFCGVTP